jgi:predicted ATPase
MPLRIVITGAPASGKTEFMERLKADSRFANFVFLEELARHLLEEEIYRRQVARENALEGKAFITDRGTADAFAFHPETAHDCSTTIENEYRRYDAVILLGSSAALGEEHYRKDDIRTESAKEVLAVEKATINVWRNHPGFHLIKAQPDSEQKYQIFLETLLAVIRE